MFVGLFLVSQLRKALAMKNPPALTEKDGNRAVIQDKQSSSSTAPDCKF
jgi:hypothetical protein